MNNQPAGGGDATPSLPQPQPPRNATASDEAHLADLFLDDAYSIEALLSKIRLHKLGLRQLREQLLQHQQHLNQSSLELFNASYDRFYRLSYLIACLSEPIQVLSKPIQGFRERLRDVSQSHDTYVDQLSHKLQRLEAVNRNKQVAARLIELIKTRDRLELLFSQLDWSLKAVDRESRYGQDKSKAGSLLSRPQQYLRNAHDLEHSIKCDLLERVNVELHYLSCEVSAIEPTDPKLITLKRSLKAQLGQRQAQLDQWFERAYLEAIELKDRPLIDLIIHTYRQRNCHHRLDSIWRNKVLRPAAASLEASLANQPLSEIPGGAEPDATLSQFRVKICLHVYVLVTDCLAPDVHVEALELNYSELICRIINRFAEWLSKLNLSDFRCVTTSTSGSNLALLENSSRQTNFLAKQDAIMRLLIEDCARLSDLINKFLDKSPASHSNKRLLELRKELIGESFAEFNRGLNNVKNLQRLLER